MSAFNADRIGVHMANTTYCRPRKQFNWRALALWQSALLMLLSALVIWGPS